MCTTSRMEENKKGEEMDDDTLNSIYMSVAKKLDKEIYNKYFNQTKS